MTDIADYESRITAALDRIASGIETGLGGGDNDSLRTALDALETERTVSAQLEERVRVLKEKQEETIASLENRVSTLQASIGKLEGEAGRLRGVNAQLRDINETLRDQAREGISEPHLINKSMLAELEALRAAQSSDRSELDGLINELGELVGEDA